MTFALGGGDIRPTRGQLLQIARPRLLECLGALVVSLGGFLALPGTIAAATPAAEAENLIREGVALRREKHDEKALPLFQKAYDLVRNPRTAGQLGLCELGVGYSIEAQLHIKEALASPEHPWVAKNQASLEAALKRAQQNIGTLSVTGAPSGAEIYVNGHASGQLPLRDPIRMARGEVDVELRAPGYVTSHRSLTVTATPQTVDIKLQKEPVAVAAVPKASEPAPLAPISGSPATAAGEEPAGTTPPEPTTPRGRGLRWAALGVGVLAVGGLAFAGVETFLWQSDISKFNHVGDPNVGSSLCAEPAPNRGADGCLAIYNRYTSEKNLAIIGYAAGGALAATALTLFLISPRSSSSSSEKVAFGCAPDLVNPGGSCRFWF